MEIQKEIKDFVFIKFGSSIDGEEVFGETELDIDNHDIILKVVNEELAKGHVNFMLELKNIKYVDSSGFSTILTSYKSVIERGGMFKIMNPSDHVKRVLDILRIEM
ncbi:MAG: hypothetical protein A2Y40_00800 [Candidatus Margulisbacteria bacterium GWF2_35_9]|nr:MAG: hypothetical protein A2Y40_00800 [Candidatus Margulisbacteria bacterium GWF2_35_9]